MRFKVEQGILLFTAAAMGVLAVGCSGSTPASADAMPPACATDPRVSQYTAGMAITGSAGYGFTLDSATPAPPEQGNNDWQVTIDDPSGSPVNSAKLTITPWMPDHGHGTRTPIYVHFQSAGKYDISPINLWMPGYWRTKIAVLDAQGNTADFAYFKFCIGG